MMTKSLGERLIVFFATGAWSGFSPVASGTAGSLVGLLIYLPLSAVTPISYLLFTVVLTLFGVWISGLAEAVFGEKDSGKIVIDEIAGMLVTMLFIPFTWEYIVSGFLLFRLFDIFKPLPRLENLRGGWGVMMDDIAAGVIANLILRIIILWGLF